MISDNSKDFDLKSFLANLTTHSGVYRMLDKHGEIIYVGKAKNLKNRVNSYFSKGAKDSKTIMMVEQVARIEITITPSDYEAYLLENSLICGRYWTETFKNYNPSLVRDNLYGFNWFKFNGDYASFPFSHATFIFSFSVSMWVLFPKYKWLWVY